jgi:hypothetical protein
VLIELGCSEQPARWHQRLVQFIDNRGFADAGISRDQHQFRHAALDDAVEGGEQGLDLARSPVQLLRDQQAVGRVILRKREIVDPVPKLPFGKAVPEIPLCAGCGLVTLLGDLGEQPHNELGDRRRHTLEPLAWRHRLSGDMAVHPLHRIGRGKWKRAGEHLIEGDAKCIQVGSGVDRTIHAPGLLGGHVGKCACDLVGGRRRLPLARTARRKAEAGEPHVSLGTVHQDIGWFDILVYEAALMDPAQACCDLDGEAQEAADLHRGADQPGQWLAAMIFEHENGPGRILHELQRLRGPGAVKFVSQFIFVRKAIETLRCRMFCGRKHRKHNVLFAVDAVTAGPAQQEPFVLGQDLWATGPAWTHERRKVHVDQPFSSPVPLPSPGRLARLACGIQLRERGRPFDARHWP